MIFADAKVAAAYARYAARAAADKARMAALGSKGFAIRDEFLLPVGAEVGSEASFGNGVVGDLHGCFCSVDAVAAVSDVGEGSAVDECRGVFKSLYQVRLDGILHEEAIAPWAWRSAAVTGFLS